MRSLRALRLLAVVAVTATFAAGAVVALVAAVPGLAAVESRTPVPDLYAASTIERSMATTVVAADGRRIASFRPEELHVPILGQPIPPAVRTAVIAAEDEDFDRHPGIDVFAIARAAIRNVAAGEVQQGGSTITQQLVKNLFTSADDSLDRKIEEAHLALVIEDHYTKDEILGAYLDTTYFGEGAIGIAAAARTYFGKDVQELSLSEAAMLAGIIPAPSAYNPRTDPELAEARRLLVLDRVEEEGLASADELAWARASVPEVLPRRGTTTAYPYFVDYVRRWLLDVAGFDPKLVFSGGLRVETTLEPALQDATLWAIATHLPDPAGPSGAGVVVDNATGAVRALVGGRDWDASQVNLALGELGAGSGRQAGSSFKPFVLATLLEHGASLHDTIPAPERHRPADSDREVGNYSGRGYGTLSLLDATRRSINTAYVIAAELAGPDAVAALARSTGVEIPADVGSSVALGAYEVSPLEMATGYAAFARDGRRLAPTPVRRVLGPDGEVLFDAGAWPEPPRVMSVDTARLVTAALTEVVRSGTGTRAALDRPVAGKTGTTDAYTNAWFVGYTPRMTAAVWVGDPAGNVPLLGVNGVARVTGGSIPASIWHDVAAAAVAGTEPVPFPPAPDRPPSTTTTTTTLPPTTTSSTSTTSTSTTTTLAPTTTTRPPTTTAPPTTPPPPPTTTTTAPPVTLPPVLPPTTQPPPPSTTTTTTAPTTTTTTTTAPPPPPTTTTAPTPPTTTTTTVAPTTTTSAPPPSSVTLPPVG